MRKTTMTTTCTQPDPKPAPQANGATTPLRLRRATATCAWVSRRHHVLRINRVTYTLVPADSRYRLVNWASGQVYDIDAAGRWCTCPAFVWDHCPVQANGDGRCKHIA